MKISKMKVMTIATVVLATVLSSFSNLSAQPVKKYGEDSIQCIQNISLYSEFYKQKNYKDAYPYWSKVIAGCPAASQNSYIHGVRIVTHRIGLATDLNERNAWIDTLMMVYDKRIEHFGHDSRSREGLIRGRQALDLMNLRPTDTMVIYEYLRKSVDLEQLNVDPIVASNYFLQVNTMVACNIFPPDSLLSAYDHLSDIAEANIAECTKNNSADLDNWNNMKALIESVFEPFATCEHLISIYSKKFDQALNDTTALKKITFMLDRKNCTDSDLFLDATEQLHKLKPTPTSAYLMGKLMMREKDYEKAEAYFLEAMDGLTPELQENAYVSLAAIKIDSKNYSSARSYLNNALKISPNAGKYYIMIGDLYAASAGMCKGETEIDERAVYWAAVDKYIKAKNVDPEVAEEANKKISLYSAHFPTRERLFFNVVDEGSRYTVGCWINETTIVRASK